MSEKVESNLEEQPVVVEIKKPNMLTVQEFNKRVTLRSTGFKPGVCCDKCGSEVLVENPNIISRDPHGPRHTIAKCTNAKCKYVYKLFIRN